MKAETLGSEWAVVVAMIFIFIIGFVLGGMTVYILTRTTRRPIAVAPIAVAAPPPAGPAAEEWIVKGKGKGKHAPITRRPTTNTIVITKTGDACHRDGCHHLTVGDRTNTNKSYERCLACYRDDSVRYRDD